eukprot:CAMPEP_0179005252 /NCGR_PEP_ID=MMETSP0795-20121207/13803_1 /TAXON_ID=88552 /ORGANISM="Amoebophrya sp., Strain Ameob2" /LENGTH=1727 /DNA_ID=CAMNT_0020699697 /DNA_START=567 /DNA_END=5750 /DNA_ORIENTATION=-
MTTEEVKWHAAAGEKSDQTSHGKGHLQQRDAAAAAPTSPSDGSGMKNGKSGKRKGERKNSGGRGGAGAPPASGHYANGGGSANAGKGGQNAAKKGDAVIAVARIPDPTGRANVVNARPPVTAAVSYEKLNPPSRITAGVSEQDSRTAAHDKQAQAVATGTPAKMPAQTPAGTPPPRDSDSNRGATPGSAWATRGGAALFGEGPRGAGTSTAATASAILKLGPTTVTTATSTSTVPTTPTPGATSTSKDTATTSTAGEDLASATGTTSLAPTMSVSSSSSSRQVSSAAGGSGPAPAGPGAPGKNAAEGQGEDARIVRPANGHGGKKGGKSQGVQRDPGSKNSNHSSSSRAGTPRANKGPTATFSKKGPQHPMQPSGIFPDSSAPESAAQRQEVDVDSTSSRPGPSPSGVEDRTQRERGPKNNSRQRRNKGKGGSRGATPVAEADSSIAGEDVGKQCNFFPRSVDQAAPSSKNSTQLSVSKTSAAPSEGDLPPAGNGGKKGGSHSQQQKAGKGQGDRTSGRHSNNSKGRSKDRRDGSSKGRAQKQQPQKQEEQQRQGPAETTLPAKQVKKANANAPAFDVSKMDAEKSFPSLGGLAGAPPAASSNTAGGGAAPPTPSAWGAGPPKSVTASGWAGAAAAKGASSSGPTPASRKGSTTTTTTTSTTATTAEPLKQGPTPTATSSTANAGQHAAAASTTSTGSGPVTAASSTVGTTSSHPSDHQIQYSASEGGEPVEPLLGAAAAQEIEMNLCPGVAVAEEVVKTMPRPVQAVEPEVLLPAAHDACSSSSTTRDPSFLPVTTPTPRSDCQLYATQLQLQANDDEEVRIRAEPVHHLHPQAFAEDDLKLESPRAVPVMLSAEEIGKNVSEPALPLPLPTSSCQGEPSLSSCHDSDGGGNLQAQPEAKAFSLPIGIRISDVETQQTAAPDGDDVNGEENDSGEPEQPNAELEEKLQKEPAPAPKSWADLTKRNIDPAKLQLKVGAIQAIPSTNVSILDYIAHLADKQLPDGHEQKKYLNDYHPAWGSKYDSLVQYGLPLNQKCHEYYKRPLENVRGSNQCYVNCVIQLLLTCKPLSMLLSHAGEGDHARPFFQALREVCKEFNKPQFTQSASSTSAGFSSTLLNSPDASPATMPPGSTPASNSKSTNAMHLAVSTPKVNNPATSTGAGGGVAAHRTPTTTSSTTGQPHGFAGGNSYSNVGAGTGTTTPSVLLSQGAGAAGTPASFSSTAESRLSSRLESGVSIASGSGTTAPPLALPLAGQEQSQPAKELSFLNSWSEQALKKRSQFGVPFLVKSGEKFQKVVQKWNVKADSQQDCAEFLLFLLQNMHEESKWFVKSLEDIDSYDRSQFCAPAPATAVRGGGGGVPTTSTDRAQPQTDRSAEEDSTRHNADEQVAGVHVEDDGAGSWNEINKHGRRIEKRRAALLEDSVVYRIFSHTVETRTASVISEEPFLTLDLHLPELLPACGAVRLEDLVNTQIHTSEEIVNPPVISPAQSVSTQNVNVTVSKKVTKVENFPPYLIVNIKRHRYLLNSIQKVAHKVQFGGLLKIFSPEDPTSSSESKSSTTSRSLTASATEQPAQKGNSSNSNRRKNKNAEQPHPQNQTDQQHPHQQRSSSSTGPPRAAGPPTAMYALSSFILHHGEQTESGHYICYSRYNSDWWRYDDSKVTKVANIEREVNLASVASSAYVFLYERITSGFFICGGEVEGEAAGAAGRGVEVPKSGGAPADNVRIQPF